MFDSVGWGEILVLVVAGLFILGPERLPGAAAWLGRTIRQVRDYATGAQSKLKDELGADFEELRKPLQDLQQIRGFNPRTAVRRALFDGEADPLGLNALNGRTNGAPAANGASLISETGPAAPPAARPAEQLKPDERPPIDPDAT